MMDLVMVSVELRCSVKYIMWMLRRPKAAGGRSLEDAKAVIAYWLIKRASHRFFHSFASSRPKCLEGIPRLGREGDQAFMIAYVRQ